MTRSIRHATPAGISRSGAIPSDGDDGDGALDRGFSRHYVPGAARGFDSVSMLPRWSLRALYPQARMLRGLSCGGGLRRPVLVACWSGMDPGSPSGFYYDDARTLLLGWMSWNATSEDLSVWILPYKGWLSGNPCEDWKTGNEPCEIRILSSGWGSWDKPSQDWTYDSPPCAGSPLSSSPSGGSAIAYLSADCLFSCTLLDSPNILL